MKSTMVLLSGAVLLVGLSFQFVPHGQHAQSNTEAEEEEETPGVTESELELYIEVYKAMQSNHALTIEEALKSHGLSLETFRNTERRIQKEQRYVERVRKALLDYARSRAATAALPPDESQSAPAPQ
jgi:hypothetical protein